MRYKYKIGADPELFLVDENGDFKSAHNIIPGHKHAPTPVLNGAIQPDGVAAEFNVNPAETAEQFHEHIKDVLVELSSRVNSKRRGWKLIVQPTATFESKYFKRLPKAARELGCEPDFNAWTDGKVNPAPRTAEPFRTGAGHLHLGWTIGENPRDSAHMFDCIEAVKQLDSVLYFCSLLWDSDEKRRTLYGKLGSFRPKPYGVEYRPLSNAWVADPDLHIWIFNASMRAMDVLDDGSKIYDDYGSKAMIADAQKEKKISRIRLLEHHDFLVEQYGIPPLPESYARMYQ